MDYRTGRSLSDPLSTIQLFAILIAKRPDMVALGPSDLPLQIEDAYRLAKALQASGYFSVSHLIDALPGLAIGGAL